MLNIINKNLDYLKSVSHIIQRYDYNKNISSFVSKSNITIITGLRRAGKSSIVIKFLENKDRVFYFSKEMDPYDQIKNNSDLTNIFEEYKSNFGEPDYIVIDEIQDINNFEIFLRYIFALKKYNIIITGSNSNLLSSELATFLSGRFIELQIYSLSLREFLFFKNAKYSKELFDEYIIYGGLPELSLISDVFVKQQYLKAIKDSIILKDIISRYNIRDYTIYSKLVSFLSDNIGNLTTGRNIVNFLKNEGIKTSLGTILDYIDFSCNAFILEKVNRFDIKGKKILEINNKYYMSELGFRSAINGDFTTKEIQAQLENFVYLELKKASYEVYIGNYDDLEIDFVAKKNNVLKYFQVSYLISDKNTFDREIKSLSQINDVYPKYIITLDTYKIGNYNGIEVISIEDFLNVL